MAPAAAAVAPADCQWGLRAGRKALATVAPTAAGVTAVEAAGVQADEVGPMGTVADVTVVAWQVAAATMAEARMAAVAAVAMVEEATEVGSRVADATVAA